MQSGVLQLYAYLEKPVPQARGEVIRRLKEELAFLERGGYGGTTPWKPVRMFLDSPSCPNRLDEERETPCTECWLFQFVPERFRAEMDPCHFVPLNEAGESVHSMTRQYTLSEVETSLREWLLTEIRHLEELEQSDKAGRQSMPRPRPGIGESL